MIGVLGGTFDPIHRAHLAIAHKALEAANLSRVLFIPCKTPVHRAEAMAKADDRLAMVKLAIRDEPLFEADDREITRSTPSYMDETLKSLHKDYPNEKFAFIMGYDVWENFTRWHHWQEIIQQNTLIIIKRPGYTLAHPKLIAQYKAIIINDNESTLSATDIRHAELSRDDARLKQALPQAVIDYIKNHALYRDANSQV
ncbi:MAG: nicotinate (nicotinamide) nucleotide adenylyltransferase [Gammaproteobacteria bacterium CG11_big_fil_rev_8_21_14_0_20_46_22]|nr:MAG: nicotinate (nicotinamide) nucleotide adenylyltransferase [Gammaproteobacteria bacterium CG12_big_fil_rev_8_21_14_0_65_46_12]PIR10836.1 MAG: nicotinate (nicotinamide) nucleotide adenylyltransferase [Gammaproteobacteria bacterium CG11_big_fil_rev_8_21_14_0_20_46_22]